MDIRTYNLVILGEEGVGKSGKFHNVLYKKQKKLYVIYTVRYNFAGWYSIVYWLLILYKYYTNIFSVCF